MDSDDATSRTSTSLLAGSVHYAAIWHTRRTLSMELRLHRYGNARSRTMSFVPTVNPHDRESAMQTITKHHIDGAFVESHGREVMDSINSMRDDSQAPWGGFNHSGFSREFGTFWIAAFLEHQAILD